MIFVILGICILMLIAGCFMVYNLDWDRIGTVLSACSLAATLACIIMITCLGIAVSKQGVVDDKIAMYLEENTKIEEQVNILVDEYMEHESEVYSNAKVTSPVVLAQMYPEIKADDMIRSQIDIYLANNEQIKALKLQKINGSVYRWWLYFGK